MIGRLLKMLLSDKKYVGTLQSTKNKIIFEISFENYEKKVTQ